MPDPREARIKRIISREYKIFKEDEMLASLPRTLYEKACNKSEKILTVKASGKSGKKLQDAIDFCHLNVTPTGAMSFTSLFMIISFLIVGSLISLNFLFPVDIDNGKGGVFPQYSINKTTGEPILNKTGYPTIIGGFNPLPVDMGAFILMLLLFFTYYIYSYPFHLKKKYEVETSSDMVTMILYMAMFMRNVPSLEGAVKFSSENISGFLGYELKKMLWDVEVGNFLSMQEALVGYTKKWEANREFVESVELMITSLGQIGEKRIKMLDESVDIILEGTKEKARNFNQQLKLPVMIVHALGIILPVMGLVMFPLVSIFLGIGSSMLFIGYDVILPLVLYFVIVKILESRPLTLSKIDISENPDVPPPGKFFLGKKPVRAWPIGFIVGAAIIGIGLVSYNAESAFAEQNGVPFQGIVAALLITLGISLGFGIYFMLLARTRTRVRAETRQVEGEFAEALFQLGSQISGGSPIEVSIEKSMDRIENLRIKKLFEKALNNMKMLGYTFEQAFFDPEYGAVRFYPSKMIKSVIKTVVESTKKGVNTAANAMLSVSRYLKGLHSTQEDVKEQLSDTINSLKFQAYFLSPMISGVIVTMALIIIQILQQLNIQTANLGSAVGDLGSIFGQIKITPFEFIMVVGIYLIETAFILAFFTNEIESGDDDTGLKKVAGNSLVVGYIVFVMIFAATYMLFAPLITQVV
jgi:Type II secretion system (T2SS), protein F